MVRFGKTEISEENFYAAKKPIKIWDFNVDNIEYWDNCAYEIVSKQITYYLDEYFRRLNITLLRQNWYKRRNWSC